MADERINAFATTATSPAADDFMALDGTTNGSRKWASSHFQNLGTGDSPTFTNLLNTPVGTTTPSTGNFTTVNGTTITATTQLIGKGTATNDSASAGYIGEYKETKVAVASRVALTSAADTNVTSVSLTAGDWDVTGVVNLIADGASRIDGSGTLAYAAITSTSATLPGFDGGAQTAIQPLAGNGYDYSIVAPTVRFSLAGTTTVYLVTNVTHNATSADVGAYGIIRARRMR